MTAPRPWCTPRRRRSRPRSSSGCGGRSRRAGLDRRWSRRGAGPGRGPASLGSIARGAEVVPAESLGAGVVRRDVAGVVRAVVAVRLGPGRWIELRARPEEAGAAPWLVLLLGLVALGPVA